MTERTDILAGRRPILEALNKGRPIDKIWMRKGGAEGTLKLILAKAKEQGILVQEVHKQKLDELAEQAQTANYQGVIAFCAAARYADIADMLADARSKNEDPFLLLLDGITDPHNVGAILRSANASGVHGVIIPKHRAAGLTAAVSKASAGAVEHVKIAKAANLTRAIEALKKEGLFIGCAGMDGDVYFEAPLTGPTAIVIGGEGAGVSRLVREHCDFALTIPMYGEIQSLNASVAAGLIMYEVVRRRKFTQTRPAAKAP